MRVPTLLAILLGGALMAVAQFGTIPNTAIAYTSNGSTQYLLQKVAVVSGVSRSVNATTADTTSIIGIALSTAAAGESIQVGTYGAWQCVFDGATTAGDYVQVSTTVNGNCHDAGATFPTSGQVLGRVATTNAGAGTYLLSIFGTEIRGVAAGGSGTVTDFSAGTLSPIFTTSVATSTTTPALTFTLSNFAAHAFLRSALISDLARS